MMSNQILTYFQKPLAKTEKTLTFPTFDVVLYAVAMVGAIGLTIEFFSVLTPTAAALSVAILGLFGFIFVRHVQTARTQIALLKKQSTKKGELRFNNLIKDSKDVTGIFELDGTIIFLSPSVKKALGYSADASLGLRSFNYIHPDDAETLRREYQKAFDDSHYVFTGEFRYRHFNGAWRVLEGTGRQFQDEDGQVIGILHNSRDITERKLAENQLRVFTSQLEQSNRELQDFAYVASHDLQEPLRKVQAFGDRLNKKYAEKLGAEGADYVKRMRDAADRMQTLIDELLKFSRITTKAQPFVQTDLTRIAREVLFDLEIKIEETGAEIEVAELPTIDADPLQMRQLLQNLIGNALKFSRPGITPQIKIYPLETCETDTDIHKTVALTSLFEFAVEDNGIGFDEKYLDRIFTVFQRLHGRSEYEGSGVGLAVCRKITERHGGKITAQSSPDQGATFIVSLPYRQLTGGFLDE